MSQDEKKGCLVVSLSKNDKIVIDGIIDIEIKSRNAHENVSAKLVIRAPLSSKIKKVKLREVV